MDWHDLRDDPAEPRRPAFFQLHLGGDRNYHYLLGDRATGLAAAVDPGFDPDAFHRFALAENLKIADILITHGHQDHTGGAAQLAALTGARVHAGDPRAVPGARPLTDGQRIPVGGTVARALATPGHAPDHFCFLWEGRLMTGDLLFCGKVGGTGAGFPGSSARQEFASLQRILQLPAPTGVYPGHDYYGGQGTMASSTIGWEKQHNPFLICGDFTSFCRLKDTWTQYKKEHGIR